MVITRVSIRFLQAQPEVRLVHEKKNLVQGRVGKEQIKFHQMASNGW